nr:choice-of-anchor C family protein [uncultured Duganella sp.]
MANIKALVVTAAALSALASTAQSSELIDNGGFESDYHPGSFIELSSGLSGWTITAGSVDLINGYWQAAGGSYSIDLNGGSAATLSQSFATNIGQLYNVSFSMAGNPDGGGAVKSIMAGVTGMSTFTFDGTGASHGAMNWQARSFSFVASSSLSTLTFAGDSSTGPYGVALDNVSVTAAVPEPETYGMLIAGLGVLGLLARRRRGAEKN